MPDLTACLLTVSSLTDKLRNYVTDTWTGKPWNGKQNSKCYFKSWQFTRSVQYTRIKTEVFIGYWKFNPKMFTDYSRTNWPYNLQQLLIIKKPENTSFELNLWSYNKSHNLTKMITENDCQKSQY